MISLVSGFLFVGYMLVYAAVKGDPYRPWDSLFPEPPATPRAAVKHAVAAGVGRTRPGG